MPQAKYVLDEAAHDFFQTCSKRERVFLLDAFAQLRDRPRLGASSPASDDVGRTLLVARFGSFAVFYWEDARTGE